MTTREIPLYKETMLHLAAERGHISGLSFELSFECNGKQVFNPIDQLIAKKKHVLSATQLQECYCLCNLFESFMSGQKNRVGIYRGRYRLELLTKYWWQTRRRESHLGKKQLSGFSLGIFMTPSNMAVSLK